MKKENPMLLVLPTKSEVLSQVKSRLRPIAKPLMRVVSTPAGSSIYFVAPRKRTFTKISKI